MLNGEADGIKVAIYKVKAHVGMHGNEMSDEVAKQACVEGEYGLNHDNTGTMKLEAICRSTGRKLDGHQAISNHARSKVREVKMTGKDNVIQRMKRKLETGPEEWETKKQRIAITEAEYAQRNEEPNGPEEGEEAARNTWPEKIYAQQMQEDEIELQQMEQEEEAALMLAQNTQVLPQETGGHETHPRVENVREDNDEDPPRTQDGTNGR
ncbi:hypothetical protein CYMTET_35259 [Cymbomonas tetramitiformis]|uniref:RNase H type-1 domain-containing protein n=1 Tax=Cymbomonas tetramitiformis TaxID=36881 RepID=A0AAE0F9M8_9CHLO|nr:hypothetical protein CYMTET_35259 [Cymbomonas tetramitiformis]